MVTAVYRIERSENGWSVEHDGETIGPYATKAVALEAAFAAARRAARAGHAIVISAPESEGEPQLDETAPITLKRS